MLLGENMYVFLKKHVGLIFSCFEEGFGYSCEDAKEATIEGVRRCLLVGKSGRERGLMLAYNSISSTETMPFMMA